MPASSDNGLFLNGIREMVVPRRETSDCTVLGTIC
jgi:hypothetical protein